MFVRLIIAFTYLVSSTFAFSLQPIVAKVEGQLITASALIIANTPTEVLAVIEDDDYEYGAVDAPIGIAVGAGVLAILTALLPIALRGGEEAFEEIREREAETFGKNNKDVLKSRK